MKYFYLVNHKKHRIDIMSEDSFITVFSTNTDNPNTDKDCLLLEASKNAESQGFGVLCDYQSAVYFLNLTI